MDFDISSMWQQWSLLVSVLAFLLIVLYLSISRDDWVCFDLI